MSFEAEVATALRSSVATGAPLDFEAWALRVFRHQFEQNAPYRRYCERRGTTPASIARWEDVPAVPTRAFRTTDLACGAAEATFRTSGTTGGAAARGRHLVPSLDLYRASTLPTFEQFVLPDGAHLACLFLLPPPALRPDSSLVHMCAWVGEAFGTSVEWLAGDGGLDLAQLAERLRALQSTGEAVLLAGPTAGFVRLFDLGTTVRLGPGTRLMDTGGQKGLDRPVSRAGFRARAGRISASRLLLRQRVRDDGSARSYDSVLRDRFAGGASIAGACSAARARTRVLDPDTLAPVRAATRLLCHHDLANAGSASVVLTEDAGGDRRRRHRVTGRVPGAARALRALLRARAVVIARSSERSTARRRARADARRRSGNRVGAAAAAALARGRRARTPLPEVARPTAPMVAAVLPLVAEQLDADTLVELHAREGRGDGPALVAHVLASNVPALAIPAIALALLARAAVVVKSGRADPHSASAFQRALVDVDPELGAMVVPTYWRGGARDVEDAVLARADRIVATGAEASLAALARFGQRPRARKPRERRRRAPDVDDAMLEALAWDVARSSSVAVCPPPAPRRRRDARVIGERLLHVRRPRKPPAADAADGGGAARAEHRARECVVRRWHGPRLPARRRRGRRAASSRGDRIPHRLRRYDPDALRSAGRVRAGHDRVRRARGGRGTRRRGAAGPRGRAPLPRRAHATAAHRLAAWAAPGARLALPRLGSSAYPGGAVSDLSALFLRHVCQTSDGPMGLVVARASGSTVWDVGGNAYLDLLAGMGVANVGHAHPEIVAAVRAQAERHLHVMVYGEFVQETQVRLATKLASLLPRSLSVVYFTSSGAEAIDGALKTARKHTGRPRFVAFEGGFHGDTWGALSIGGNPIYRRPFEPLLEPVTLLPFDDEAALAAIDGSVAAVVVEPVQAEGGVRIPRPGFLAALRARCDAAGALLVFDEVVTAFGRTGRLFGHEHWGVVPTCWCSPRRSAAACRWARSLAVPRSWRRSSTTRRWRT